MTFFSHNRRIFDGGIRDSGGTPQIRPAWVADPTLYPIEDLQWGAYLDARDTPNIILDGNGDVKAWQSSVVSNALAVSEPYRFTVFGEVEGVSNPSLNIGTATPSGEPHISFNGAQRFRSGNHYYDYVNRHHGYGWYTSFEGVGLDQGIWIDPVHQSVNPTAYVMSALWAPDYTGAGGDTWVGTASAGTSASNNLLDPSGWITAGASSNNYVMADFPGYGYMTGDVMSTYLLDTAWTVSVVFFADVATADAGAGNEFLNPAIITDSNAVFILSYTDAGINLHIADGIGAYSALTIPCATGVWHQVVAWYDGTTLHLQLDNGTPVTEVHDPIGSLVNTLVVGSSYDQGAFFDGQILQITMSASDIGAYYPTMGRWNQDHYNIDTNFAASFYQYTAANVPLYTGGARADGVDDYLDSKLSLGDVFDPTGTAGTVTFAFYGDAAAAFNPGTVTAQTPYSNAGILSDAAGYFTITFTDVGITAGAYDGVPRDSGGGPGTNDGWQMVSAALPVTTDAIVQVRWGLADKLELRIVTYAGYGAWQTCDFSGIAVTSGKLRLFSDYALTYFAAGIIYDMNMQDRRLTDQEADDAIRTISSAIGINTTKNVPSYDAYVPLGPEGTGGPSPGNVTFAVARTNNRTTDYRGYLSQWIWGANSSYFGLGSTQLDGVAKLTTFAFDGGGAVDYNVDVDVPDDTWALVTTEYKSNTLKTKLNGVNSDFNQSASAFIAYGGVPATVGSAVNGFTPAIFNGTTEGLVTTETAAQYISRTGYTSISLVYVPSTAATSGNPHTDPAIWAEAGMNCGLTFSSSGAAAIVYDGTQVSVTKACSTGAYHLIVTRLDGANLNIRIDGVDGTPAACGAVSGIPSAIVLGTAPGIGFQAVRVLAQIFATSYLLDSQVDGIGKFLATRYAQSLGVSSATSIDPRLVPNVSTWLASYAGDPWAGVVNSATSLVLPSNPISTTQFIYMGYGNGGYLDGALAFWAAAPTSGWSDVRIQDVEAYLNTVFLTATGGTSPIDALVNGTSTVVAALTGAGAIASTIAGTCTITGLARGAGALASTVASTCTITGNLLGAGAIASTVASTSTIVATLNLHATVAGTSTITAAITANGAVASTIAGTSTITAAINGALPAAATIASTSTVTANLLGAGAIASTIAGTSTITGNVLGAGSIASTIPGSSTIIATLQLFATVNGTSTIAANLLGSAAITSTVAGTSAITAAINGAVPAASTIAGTSTVTSNLLGAGAVTSTINGISTVTAPLLATGNLASTIAGTSTVSAYLDIHATVNGTSTITAALLGAGAIASTSAGTSTVVAAINGELPAASTVAGTSTVTAAIEGLSLANAQVDGIATITANLVGAGSLTSTVANTSTVVATLDLHSTVAGTSTVVAGLTANGAVTSTIAGTSTTTAGLTATGELASTIAGISTIAADLLAGAAIASTVAGSSTVTATAAPSAIVAGTSTITANLLATGELASTIAGASTAVATLSLHSTVSGTSTIIAAINGAAELESTIDGEATVEAAADLTGYVAATITSSATITAAALGAGAIESTINGTSTCVLTSVEGDIVAIVDSTSDVIASINGSILGASTVAGTSTVTADLKAAGTLASTSNSTSTIVASITALGDMASTVSGLATIAASITANGYLSATIDSSATITAGVLGAGFIAVTVTGISTTTAAAAGMGNITATIDGTSTIVASFDAGSAVATVTGNSTVTGSITGQSPASSTVSSISTTSANLLATGPLVSTITGVSTTTANVLGSANASAQVNGTSTVTGNIIGTAPGAIEAVVSSVSTVQAAPAASGAMFAICNNESFIQATIENLDLDIVNINAMLHGTASVSAYLVNYLADKKINDPTHIMSSGEELYPYTPPHLIHETDPPQTLPPTEPTPPPPSPVVPTHPPAIMKSADHVTSPIVPKIIVKVVPIPDPIPDPVIPEDPAIQKSGTTLASPIIPGRIKKSDNSIN